MTTRALATALLTAALAPTAFAQSQFDGWHSDLKTAAGLAAKSGKPLFVVFRCER